MSDISHRAAQPALSMTCWILIAGVVAMAGCGRHSAIRTVSTGPATSADAAADASRGDSPAGNGRAGGSVAAGDGGTSMGGTGGIGGAPTGGVGGTAASGGSGIGGTPTGGAGGTAASGGAGTNGGIGGAPTGGVGGTAASGGGGTNGGIGGAPTGGVGGTFSGGNSGRSSGVDGGAAVSGGAGGTDASPANGGATAGSGGSGMTGGACSETPIDASQATAAYTAYAFRVNPDLNPLATFIAEELNVPGLWEALQGQLFIARVGAQPALQACSFMYRHCEVTVVVDGNFMFGEIVSGLVANGALYYSWHFGSGIYYSSIGKVSADGSALVQTVGPFYMLGSPPPLVLEAAATEVLVYRAETDVFNVWSTKELFGTLKDYGDRLAIVDSTGQEIPGRAH